MRIALKNSDSHWIEVKDDEGEISKLLIDYPDLDQQEHLETLYYDAFGGLQIKESELDKERTFYSVKFLKFKRQLLRCVIKDWEDFLIDDDKKKIDPILKNNELDKDQWWAIVKNESIVNKLYEVIAPEIEWSGSDKKKLNLPES